MFTAISDTSCGKKSNYSVGRMRDRQRMWGACMHEFVCLFVRLCVWVCVGVCMSGCACVRARVNK